MFNPIIPCENNHFVIAAVKYWTEWCFTKIPKLISSPENYANKQSPNPCLICQDFWVQVHFLLRIETIKSNFLSYTRGSTFHLQIVKTNINAARGSITLTQYSIYKYAPFQLVIPIKMFDLVCYLFCLCFLFWLFGQKVFLENGITCEVRRTE